MNKSQKMKNASRKARNKNIMQWVKKIVLFPVRVCQSIWKWIKSIDVVGMVNLTLLVAIIVLFSALVSDFIKCDNGVKMNRVNNNNVVNVSKPVANNNKIAKSKQSDSRRVIKRTFKTTLPLQADKQTGITPKIKTVGVKKPVLVKEMSFPSNELPKQDLYGDVIVDIYKDAPVLSNGVKVNGNLYIQNMRKYTLPCDAKIEGNLFIRNVDKLSFCGAFTVKGNIYVNRQSSFGPIPRNARVGGQIIL